MKHNLSERQLKALELLGKGCTVTEVAKAVGVSRNTIYRWLSKDANFVNAKNRIENQIYDSLLAVAVNEMQEILIDGTINQKIPVIQLLAKMNGKVIENIQSNKQETTLDVNAFLDKLGI